MLDKVVQYVLDPLMYLLIGVAIVVFLWGAVEFVATADDPEGRDRGKRHLLWGIVGLFIIFASFGILNLIQNTLVGLFG